MGTLALVYLVGAVLSAAIFNETHRTEPGRGSVIAVGLLWPILAIPLAVVLAVAGIVMLVDSILE